MIAEDCMSTDKLSSNQLAVLDGTVREKQQKRTVSICLWWEPEATFIPNYVGGFVHVNHGCY